MTAMTIQMKLTVSLGMVSACQWRDFTNATTAVDVYPLALFVTETGIVLTIVMKEANVKHHAAMKPDVTSYAYQPQLVQYVAALKVTKLAENKTVLI